MRGSIVKKSKSSHAIIISLGRDSTTGKQKQLWKCVKGGRREAEKKLAELLHQMDTGTFTKPGKTTVAVSLALSKGYCQFMDYDVEAPNASFFIKPIIKHQQKVTIKQPYFLTDIGKDFSKCAEFCHYNAVAVAGDEVIFFPELCHGCGGCKLVGPEGAVREKEVEVGIIKKEFLARE